MSVKLSGPNDFLLDVEELLPAGSVTGRNLSESLAIGGGSWIGIEPEALKNSIKLVVKKVIEFVSKRPNAKIVIGDISITLENVSEAAIEKTIELAIKHSKRRGK